MKKQILAIALVGALGVSAVLAQGTMKFSNFEGTLANPTLKALVFGPESDSTVSLSGQPANGVPVGTVVYSGTPILGTTWTAALYIGATAAEAGASMTPISTANFSTASAGAGMFGPKTVTVANHLPGTTLFYQVRVWDKTKAADWAAVLADASVLRGMAAAVVSGQLGGTDADGNVFLPPAMTRLTSFNLFAPIPEPSIVGLGILGGLGLFLIRRRK